MVFEVFRRRQKQWLAILAVSAMLLFVLGGVLERLFGSRNMTGRDRPVAKVWGRTVYASEFGRIQDERQVANAFIQQAESAVGLPSRGGFPYDDNAVVEELILTGWADKAGITATDEDVQSYIDDLTDNKLSREAFRAILTGDMVHGATKGKGQRARNGLGVSERELFNILGRRLRFLRARQYMTSSVVRDTPYDQWKQREPMLTLAQIEFIKVAADKFVGQEQPTEEAKLLEIYDKYKNIEALPESKSPGFKIPARFTVEYITADVDKFLDKVTVTDEELRKHYNENQTEYEEDPVIPPPPRNLPAPASTNAPGINVPNPDASKKDASKTTAPKTDAKTEKPPAPPVKSDKKEEGKKTSFHFVPVPWNSFLSLSASPALAGLYIQEKKADSGAAQDKNGANSKPQASSAKPAAKPDEQKSDDKKAASPGTATVTDDKKGTTNPANIAPPADNKPKIKPFEKVRDDVAKQVKRKKAFEYVRNQLSKIVQKDTMYAYSDKYNLAKKTGGDNPTLPTPPDLKKIAEANKWEYNKKEMISRDQLFTLPGIGTSARAQSGGQGMTRDPFATSLDRLGLFRGLLTQDFNGTKMYISWKTAEKPAEVPPLDAIKPQVVKVWREELAIPKAVKEAERLAEIAKTNNGDLSKAITKESGFVLITTPPFSRMASQARFDLFTPRRLVYNKVPEIPAAGEKFMEAIFKMKKGDISILSDDLGRDQYVVKLKERIEPNFQSFAKDYAEEIRTGRDGFMLMFSEPYQRQRAETFEAIRAESGFEFLDRSANAEQTPVEES